MPEVAAGVSEIRVKAEDGSFRVFYYTASSRGVLVFHPSPRRLSGRPSGNRFGPKTPKGSFSPAGLPGGGRAAVYAGVEP
jgi:hypothetical protein